MGKVGNPNWKNGVSGNPKGRPPKGNALNDILEEYSRKKVEGKKNIEWLADNLWTMVRKGDLNAIKYIADRLGGRAVEKVEVSGDEESPIGVVFLPRQITPEEWLKNAGDSGSMDTTA